MTPESPPVSVPRVPVPRDDDDFPPLISPGPVKWYLGVTPEFLAAVDELRDWFNRNAVIQQIELVQLIRKVIELRGQS